MSQMGNYRCGVILPSINTLTGDTGGPIGPTGGTVNLLGGAEITVTGTAGTSTLTIAVTGANQVDIIYVGKHGNDANNGLTIEKAKLTFGAAITAAFAIAPAVVVCLDDGTYTENLTGQVGVDIYAPNASIAGVHTVAGYSWCFRAATVANGVIGFTYNTAANFKLSVGIITCTGTGIAVVCLAGTMVIECDFAEIDTGYFVGPTTTGVVILNAANVGIIDAGTFIGVAAGGGVAAVIKALSDLGTGTLIYSIAGAATNVDITATLINIQNLSNISAPVVAILNVTSLVGAGLEIGAGIVARIGGATIIDGVPIGSNVASTGDFTVVTATTPIGAPYGGLGVASPTEHGVLVGSGIAPVTALVVGTNGQCLLGSDTADPVFAALTSAGGTIAFTPAAGALNLEAGGGVVATSYLTDDANSAIPAAGVLTVAGGVNIGTSSAGSTVTIALNGTTDHRVQIGNVGGSLTSLGAAGNGQLVIGSAGADPVVAAPTNGTNITWAVGAGTLQANLVATVGVTLGGTGQTALTEHGVLVGSGVAAVTALVVGTNGQCLLGSDTADPVFATLASAGGTIAFTPAAGALNLEAGGGVVATTYATNAGNAIPAAGSLTIAGGTNVNTAGAGSTVTVNLNNAVTLTGTLNALTVRTSTAATYLSLNGNTITAAGTDTDININLVPKATGGVVIDGITTGYTGSEWYFNQLGVQTVGAVTSRLTFLVADSYMVFVKAYINGFRSTYADSLGAEVYAVAYRSAGGNVALVGAPIVNVLTTSTATVTVDVDVGTQTLRLNCTGVLAETWNWVGTFSYAFTQSHA